MFTSKIANLIDEAISDCVDFGSGYASTQIKGKTIYVTAEWTESETEIEVVLHENRIVRLSWTEEVPEQC